ncbi:hypothetical protein SAMN05660337_3082 [Maridesulfovibrio ferrireducens]|uniref:Tlde1 domain-containing protein n=1 Tax=Maridesulfovibrio ferrireducens TaxID=246191 RepID=A0A1G9KHF6_9BACT|nr:hypothetical protein SAMN05660337_3082 [Maridesulfovibrio ferrireducens]
MDVYGFCLDDPINFVDRTGLAGESEENEKDDQTKTNTRSKLAGADRDYKEKNRKKNTKKKGREDSEKDDSYLVKELRAYHGNKTLEIYSDDGPRETYKYTSGRPGETDQTIKNKGPIPSGEYEADPKEISEVEGLSYLKRRIIGGDWGHGRVPLHPSNETDTHGRDGFYIHGGDTKGSAGCIDIGDKDRTFFKNFRKTKNKVKVTVH